MANRDSQTINKILLSVGAYFLFFFHIAWRSVAMAMVLAVIIGVAFGIMQATDFMDEKQFHMMTALVATPLTLASIASIIYLQVRDRLLAD